MPTIKTPIYKNLSESELENIFENIECKNCARIICLKCRKTLLKNDSICDCQCITCLKNILNQNIQNKTKCNDCSLICDCCFVEYEKNMIYRCKRCWKNTCRTCFNGLLTEIIENNKEELYCGICFNNGKNKSLFNRWNIFK